MSDEIFTKKKKIVKVSIGFILSSLFFFKEKTNKIFYQIKSESHFYCFFQDVIKKYNEKEK